MLGLVISLIIALALYALLLIFYGDVMHAARNGFELWLNSVMPALFPFMVCASILQQSGVLNKLFSYHSHKSRIKRFLSSLAVFVICNISGLPAGARVYGYQLNHSTANIRTTYLCSYSNLSGPMFIIGALCTGMLKEPWLAVPICISHYGTAMLLYLGINMSSTSQHHVTYTADKTDTSLPSIITSSIMSGLDGMLKICATIVFFMVVITALECTGLLNAISSVFAWFGMDATIVKASITGILELTNGCAVLQYSNADIRLVSAFSSAILSFGGLCVYFQARAFIKIPFGAYVLSKVIHSASAFGIAYMITPLFDDYSQSVFATMEEETLFANSYVSLIVIISCLFVLTLILLSSKLVSPKKQT